MEYDWDVNKAAANLEKHGVSFALVESGFDWSTSITQEDRRKDYKEVRLQTLGKIKGRLYFLVHTQRHPDICRIISLRPANQEEKDFYAQATL